MGADRKAGSWVDLQVQPDPSLAAPAPGKDKQQGNSVRARHSTEKVISGSQQKSRPKMGGYCSLVILCLGGVAALSAMALVAIAATTDHWVETRVDREAVVKAGKQDEHEIVFFSRHRGLFSVCFPGTEPGDLNPAK